MGFFPDFHQIKTFGDAVAPPASPLLHQWYAYLILPVPLVATYVLCPRTIGQQLFAFRKLSILGAVDRTSAKLQLTSSECFFHVCTVFSLYLSM